MDKITNVLIVGVGGQGILLASEVLSEVFIKAGLDVKKSEVHGMAQRGGSVSSHVRAGKKVYSSLINEGEADYILSFELMESLRWAHYLSKDGLIIVNKQQIDPLPVTIGKEEYPQDVHEKLKEKGYNTIVVNAFDIAKELGNAKAVNIVLLGTLASKLPFEISIWEEVIRELVPAKILELNLNAFKRGLLSNT
ncbi:MAG: indolepyruvate oxidoreductase subunit beta [Candidatus Coatesbacteria bacterium]|nr:indolepyruvate oxidoreductase subunit beta [Candidatus Coatesbacteria bacterium]